jgi:hypothetical protein
MRIVETFVIPLKLGRPNAMFTLREIFYNEKLGRSSREGIPERLGERYDPMASKQAGAAQTRAVQA